MIVHCTSLQLGNSDQEERNRRLGEVAGWKEDTDQQFRDVEDKLRPLPDEVCNMFIKAENKDI